MFVLLVLVLVFSVSINRNLVLLLVISIDTRVSISFSIAAFLSSKQGVFAKRKHAQSVAKSWDAKAASY